MEENKIEENVTRTATTDPEEVVKEITSMSAEQKAELTAKLAELKSQVNKLSDLRVVRETTTSTLLTSDMDTVMRINAQLRDNLAIALTGDPSCQVLLEDSKALLIAVNAIYRSYLSQ